MTCAKITVKAVLLTLDGETFEGRNDCKQPQTACPRLPGEGYTKCKSICEQDSHAEIDAIRQCREAGCEPRYGSMTVHYHYICDSCLAALDALGIRYVCVPPAKEISK